MLVKWRLEPDDETKEREKMEDQDGYDGDEQNME